MGGKKKKKKAEKRTGKLGKRARARLAEDAQQQRAARAREREQRARAARDEAEARKQEMAEKAKPPSRLRLALLNVWNLAALGACAALSVVTKSPVPLAVGAGLEAGWLAFATRPRASRLLFAEQHEAAALAVKAARRQALVATLREEDAERVTRLEERRTDILRLAGDNRAIAREVLLGEVSRLEEIVEDFIDVAASCARWEAYLGSVDFDDLESETNRWEQDATRAADPEQRALAQKNLDVLLRRREQLGELRKKLTRARSQLDLIESTFRMISNEIMLMRSTDKLRDQLDDLLVGVQAVREMSVGGEGVAALDPDDAAAEQATDDVSRARAAKARTAQGAGGGG